MSNQLCQTIYNNIPIKPVGASVGDAVGNVVGLAVGDSERDKKREEGSLDLNKGHKQIKIISP